MTQTENINTTYVFIFSYMYIRILACLARVIYAVEVLLNKHRERGEMQNLDSSSLERSLEIARGLGSVAGTLNWSRNMAA